MKRKYIFGLIAGAAFLYSLANTVLFFYNNGDKDKTTNNLIKASAGFAVFTLAGTSTYVCNDYKKFKGNQKNKQNSLEGGLVK